MSIATQHAALTAKAERLTAERDEARRDRIRFVQTIEFRVKELDEARATIKRVRAVADRWSKAADLWDSEDFSLAAANLYAALEPTS